MLAWVRRSAPIVRPALLALITGACALVMFATHRAGHWWGDDWALYIRQAKGLLDLDPGRVLDENSFTVDMSRGAAFSPQLYPWGFPLLLAPLVAVLGTDLDRLAVVPVVCAAVMACCWYDLLARRIGRWVALVAVPTLLLTPLLLGWSELIQSEWPFLAAVFTALVVLDRLAAGDRLISAEGHLRSLVGLGVLTALAFTVRREGLAMVPAVAAAQVAGIFAAGPVSLWRESWADRKQRLIRLIVPHLSALTVVLAIQVLLPSPLVPKYDGTGLGNIWKYRERHVEHIAEVIGLKRSWMDDPQIFGQVWLGWTVVAITMALAVIGIVLALTVHRRRDLHLAAYAVVAFMIGGSFRVAINRYVVTVAPIVLLLAMVTVVWVSSRVRWQWVTPLVVTLLLGGILAGNIVNANTRIDRAGDFAEGGSVEWGPTDPSSIEMFDAVRQLSKPGDVIGAPKARAMALETERLTVQIDQYRPVPDAITVAYIVVERNSPTETEVATDTERFTEVWSNSRFVIFAHA